MARMNADLDGLIEDSRKAMAAGLEAARYEGSAYAFAGLPHPKGNSEK